MDQSSPGEAPTHQPANADSDPAAGSAREATGTARKPYARPQLTEHGRLPEVTQADAPNSPTPPSDRNVKEAFEAVDSPALLAAVARLPIERWSYKGEATRHLGPMAQDFATAFGLGADDRHIFTLDAAGVALAAIQGLHALVQMQQARLAALERELTALRGETAGLHRELALLDAERVA